MFRICEEKIIFDCQQEKQNDNENKPSVAKVDAFYQLDEIIKVESPIKYQRIVKAMSLCKKTK